MTEASGIGKHLVFIHYSDVYLVDLSVLSSLAQCFTNIVPLRDIRFDRNLRPRFSPTGAYITDFSTIYSAALYRAPSYNVLPRDMTVPMLRHPESCRTCQKREGVISRICLQCTKEDRKTWALHGGETYQRADWQRHEAEHAGTQPWGVENNSRFGHCSAAIGECKIFTI
ncbi:hypothetical protein EV421DRAFT_1853727 [Armillaria borealis]|uniref:Uncharacterized protein n=1 Tax=Armillaria borealis TaxID=47425 RepID=A0AA39IX50_9AGAR|nr:hypothetical protein EV421DRAFT_1853727 [Armillaria borealis]